VIHSMKTNLLQPKHLAHSNRDPEGSGTLEVGQNSASFVRLQTVPFLRTCFFLEIS
jgi:hypothetical protein